MKRLNPNVKIRITKLLIKSTLFIILALAIFVSQFFLDTASYFSIEQIQTGLSSAGILAPLLYMFIMAMAVVISPLPSLPLDIAAGAFFGPILGTAYSVIGALAGAVVSFMISRYLGRQFIEGFLGGHINFCTACSDKLLTKIVFFSRLLPVVSFDVVSYGAGLTKMSLKKFSLSTFLGMIPLTFVYNYFGSVFIFGKGLTVVIGLIMVILFFLIPRWVERKGFMHNMTHAAKTEGT